MVVIQGPWGKESKTTVPDSSLPPNNDISEKIVHVLSNGDTTNFANTGNFFADLFVKAIFPAKLELFIDDISPIKKIFFESNPHYTPAILLLEMKNRHGLEGFQLFELENIAEKTYALQINKNPKYFIGLYLELLLRYTSK